MKTKSKRFLNLATLCLALLGTTLLTTQPVKAEAVQSVGRDRSTDQMVNQSERTDNVGVLTDSDGYSTNEERDRKFGKQNGIDDGKNGYWPNVNREEIPIPAKGVDFEDEYRDGYEEGYSEGWHQEHPLLGVVFDVFDFIWDAVGGFFGSAN
ncbi:hypothetical protein [Streptococcus pyogenes]|uniref:hypothetical protein n=1 Tax=Streptococcus pyogenes TaxID=1314 RepID=UPI0010A1547E|nr:hypothetical protein [Streptococcus pyogenes]VHA87494.1 Uncharacterised protein [Streptococcus pyogenes]VHB75235.1 Uncharacterised protein [Streptococcus pyogenes]VHD21130.1 Uncharacterised protein [Streptococcus pyogenes]